MRQSLLILLFCCASLAIKAQSEVNFTPPALKKALAGLFRQSEPNLREVILSGDSKGQVSPGKFYHIENSTSSFEIRYVYIGRVNSCRSGVCFSNPGSGPEQTSEYFDYFVLYNAEGVVQLVKVYNYQATHGQEITAAAWLRQFIGYGSETKLYTGKNIDAISGATISVEGIVADIQQKTMILGSYLKLQSNR